MTPEDATDAGAAAPSDAESRRELRRRRLRNRDGGGPPALRGETAPKSAEDADVVEGKPAESREVGPALDPSVTRKGRRQRQKNVNTQAQNLVAEMAAQTERVETIKRGLARKRRNRSLGLILRLFLFVMLPTTAVGLYYFKYATDMYVSESAFVVRNAAPPSPMGGGMTLGLGATPIATLQDSIAVQDFIQSREVLERLDQDLGVIAAFQNDAIDDIQRLDPEATQEDAYTHYKSVVEVGYDPSESVIRMKITAPSASLAQAMSRQIISYSETMIDGLGDRQRIDAVTGAHLTMIEAKQALEDAHVRVSEIQQKLQVYNTDIAVGGEQSIIQALELEIEQMRADLNELQGYAAEDDRRVTDLKRDIAFKREQIAARKALITGGAGGPASLAEVNAELQRANVEVLTQQQQFMSAQQSLESAKLEAQRQLRYLVQIVKPSAPDKSTRPRRVENTALAFVIFFGVFIIVSLTVSVMREQFSV